MGNKTRRKPSLILIVVGLLMVLLPLLAYLQFQWLGKVSEREREQMQTGLRRTLSQLAQDFDREIARIYFQFQLETNDSKASAVEYAKLLAHWNATAPHPRLIQDMFLQTPTAETSYALERLNTATPSWEPADGTKEFGPRRAFGFGEPVDGSIPAVLIPTHEGRLILRLDRDYIQKEFIPSLVRTHFAGTESEYRIYVADGDEGSRVIYSSDSTATPGGNDDADESLLSLRPGFGNLAPFEMHVAQNVTRAFVHGQHALNVHMVRNFSPGWVMEAGEFMKAGQWRLAATHRAGSLDAAVAQIRHRNIAVSFGILIILAMSVGFVLISSQRAQRLARQQMEFVSTVSHELRTPLAVICSAGENLADGVVRDSDQLKNYGRVVRNEGRRLTNMVEQILSFAGIESGLKKYNFVPTDAAAVVERALTASEIVLSESGFEVERHISHDGVSVLADATALECAVQNLISNAVKYSGQSRWLGVSVYKDAAWVQISIHDRGYGISASDLPHIFEPFYRGRMAVDSQIQGSGLGLSLVQQIVTAHHGEVDVAANPEGGSTFSIRLATNV